MKTPKEPNELKAEVTALNEKQKTLTDDELKLVTGGDSQTDSDSQSKKTNTPALRPRTVEVD